MGNFALSKGDQDEPSKFFCKPHYRQLFLANPEVQYWHNIIFIGIYMKTLLLLGY